ncbi:ATP-binding protein [Thermotoga sp. SG1]|uniref:ATP-binding protein n=1 Tax=Thermotoga sp. SG1 TaxID=126739 RepID=UPI000C7562F2|nr:ATP-binding protein [Thermotoga sp. SG1]PLV55756.1 hypothetical protein AS006_08980 [Thermotoga sp. SG1]
MGKRIILKENWDILPSLFRNGDELELRGYVVGREKELKFLINDILHKNSGAILICGHRGVGKTALVYKALSEAMKRARKKNNDMMIIPVIMNAAQLEAESDKDTINPRNIIENLIRRLYAAVSTLIENKNKKSNGDNEDGKNLEEIKEEIEKLYKKAVAKEFKLTEALTDGYRKLEEEEEEEGKEFLFDDRYMIFLTFWTIGLLLILLSDSTVGRLFGALSTFPIPFYISLVWRKHRKRKQAKERSIETKELYQYDDKISNLEFDLEKIHQIFSEKKWKLIYVIDELDKLETGQVSESLKYFKHLFTQSDALFIFIGGEELYNLGTNTNQSFRSKEYTYFTTKYYLSRPLYNDLSSFIDEIIERTENLEKDDIEIFKRAVCFDAQNDFFDLKREIRNRISSFQEDGKPVIEISESELSGEYLQKARLHKYITVLFEGRYMSTKYSNWNENEELMRSIFQEAHKIINSFSDAEFEDPEGEQLTDSLIRDFHHFLYRYEALTVLPQGTKKLKIKGQEVTIRKYKYVGQISKDPPDKFEDYTEYEKRFIESLEQWVNYLLALVNAFRVVNGEKKITIEEFFENLDEVSMLLKKWGYSAVQGFEALLKIKENIINIERENIEQYTLQITNNINGLKNPSSKIIINIVSKAVLDLFSHLNLVPNSSPSADPNLFAGSAMKIKQELPEYRSSIVIRKSDYSRQILFISNNEDKLKELKETLEKNSLTHRVITVVEKDNNEEEIEGSHRIITASPKQLESSLKNLYEKLKEFFR